MNYEDFSENEKKVIEIIKNWTEKLEKKDVKICDEYKYHLYHEKSKFVFLNFFNVIGIMNDLNFDEIYKVYDFAYNKNFWLKFNLFE